MWSEEAVVVSVVVVTQEAHTGRGYNRLACSYYLSHKVQAGMALGKGLVSV
jgi:hypothetical protein